MKNIYMFPQKYILVSVPLTLILGFIIGTIVDTSFLRGTILIATIIMIYATLIGFKLKELTSVKGSKILGASIVINFVVIPVVAYLLGSVFLTEYPIMFAGLALAALLPTSGMTISWTALQKGNVPASVKLTVFGLTIGSIITPWYLLVMVGQYVNIDILATMRTIALVVFLPMFLGHITFKLLLRKYTLEQFQKLVKPNLAPLSIWAMLYVVFVSISTQATMIAENLQLIFIAIVVLIAFYGLNYVLSTFVALKFFNRNDGIALVNGTVLRNLSIAIGLAATAFGAEAALIVTIAFVVQQQSIAYYGKLSNKYWFKMSEKPQTP
ncbi:sodium:proton symporter [Anaerobacillus arseniciselenatis]|uniref:Sodium:proton symporter n=1 Tax=Anaerobacillus arseniciselenatis TaxID=85682 RepID=A0A1S2LIF0_9BACI|nr:bile acid:sodium symporter [Anaerobacillus arseniciselenatis]OIJ12292.1 sodium:proton symporter [Anaerobacillus arseniciselenatis]